MTGDEERCSCFVVKPCGIAGTDVGNAGDTGAQDDNLANIVHAVEMWDGKLLKT